MLVALLELAAMRRPQETEIVFAGLVDEELGQAGSRALAASGLQADLAIVGEPTRLQVVTCHKGDIWLQLTTRGKAAHGARPELGKNAIHEMARIVTWLDKSYTKVLRRRRHPLLGPATANIGTIAGGRQTNIVPDRCDITVDRRTLPGESDRAVQLELKKMLRQNGFVASLASTKAAPCAAMETSPELPLVRLFLKTARQRRPVGVDYFCDASVLSAAGIPSVVFGPGDIAQAHTGDEWISLESLERGKRLLVKLLQALP
jgi:acetylornithine deacetylase/succinyl-diaminopimelate desuccinylase-like protein